MIYNTNIQIAKLTAGELDALRAILRQWDEEGFTFPEGVNGAICTLLFAKLGVVSVSNDIR